MAMRECARGHVYNTDLYASCPYCNNNMNEINFADQDAGGYGRTVAPSQNAGIYGQTVAPSQNAGAYGQTVAPSQNAGYAYGGAMNPPHMSYNGNMNPPQNIPYNGNMNPPQNMPYGGNMNLPHNMPYGGNMNPVPNAMPYGGNMNGPQNESGLRSSIGRTQALQSVDQGKTVAPINYRKEKPVEEEDSANANRTIAMGKFSDTNMEQVVGWLICINGPEKGKDFRILDKQNTVGRKKGSDIHLEKDPTISSYHARIAYDSRHYAFTLIPGENTNNIYVNDEPIYQHTEIQPYDLIEFGESQFTLIPFCGEHFNWKDGLTRRKEKNLLQKNEAAGYAIA